MSGRVFNVLNLGAGLQSSRIFLAMCRGELPRPDAAVFSDTQWEPAAVYRNLEFLQEQGERNGVRLVQVTAGPIRPEILEFMRSRKHLGRKRYASAPMFIKNPDGSQGRMRRQCTKEYKIEPVDLWIRRELLSLKPGERVPKGVVVRQWFGISDDEGTRAVFPGQWKKEKVKVGTDLVGDPLVIERKRWMPKRWGEHVYPLLNSVYLPTRKIVDTPLLPRREQRADCGEWLAKHYPGRHFPRSACIGCPFRSNDEWREMRDNRPEEFADACDFDDAQRVADAQSASKRKMLVGVPYLHRQLVPLRMANLEGDGERAGAGCGTLMDGMDGLCGI